MSDSAEEYRPPPVLEAHALVRDFGPVRAVDGVTLSIPVGRCFGLLGPNGAGKTTTVEMLEGILAPTAGEVHYRGRPLDRHFRDVAGIMFQSTALQEHLTVGEALDLFARFYPRALPRDELLRQFALEPLVTRDVHRLSGGQRQRLLLAIALINDPQVVFLDEPTTGLDPQARRNLWALVREIRARGKTVILTTHYMEEAYELCDEITILDRGRIIAEGTPRALLAAHFHDVVLELPRADVPHNCADLPLTVLECGETLEILTRDIDAAIRLLIAHDVSLARLRIRERTLDDLFLELTGRELRG